MIIKNKKWGTTTDLYVHLGDESEVLGGTVDKNLPCSAGHTGSISAPGRSHMPWSNGAGVPQLLSLHSRDRDRSCDYQAHVLRLRSSRAWSLCSATREATAMTSLHTTVAPAHGNWREPVQSKENPVKAKIN